MSLLAPTRYQVLLVDDNRLDVESLRELVEWESLGTEVVEAVYSAKAALRVIRNMPVDIAILDIKMPRMSGLDLLAEMRTIQPDIHALFVSGHEEFKYARRALGLRAQAYLLKPVDVNELVTSVRSVVVELDRRRTDELHGDRVTVHDVLRQQAAQLLLDGLLTPEETTQTLHRFGIAPNGHRLFAFVAHVNDVERRLSEMDQSARGALVVRLQREVFDELEAAGIPLLCPLSGHRVAGVTIGVGTEVVRETLASAARNLSERGGATIDVGLGHGVSDPAELPESMQVATRLLNNRVFFGDTTVLTADQAAPRIDAELTEFRVHLQRLFAVLSSGESSSLEDETRSLVRWITHHGSLQATYNLVFNVLVRLDEYVEGFGIALFSVIGSEFKNADELFGFSRAEEIERWLVDRMRLVAAALETRSQSGGARLVRQIKQYVDERLENAISLTDIASYFAYSPNYLSHLFKDQTGESFSEYVIQRRLLHACELLVSTTLRIYEVADRCGYSHLGYFNRQFKERIGMSPGEYRRNSP